MAIFVIPLAQGFSPALPDRGPQQPDLSKPAVPIVSAIGCASRSEDGSRWLLTRATDASVSTTAYTSRKEIEDAKAKPLGTAQYRLIGTTEFLSPDELLKQGDRAAFTKPETANATGQLQDGRKIVVKGLLITGGGEKRINLLSVQRLADTCQ